MMVLMIRIGRGPIVDAVGGMAEPCCGIASLANCGPWRHDRCPASRNTRGHV